MKKLVLASFAAATAMATAGSGFGQDAPTSVNVYNWGDYIDPMVNEEFTKATGITVNYDVFDSNETLEGKLLVGNSGYDVVVPSNNFLGRQIGSGVYAELDKAAIPNIANVNPELLRLLEASDPGNTYGLPYLWGATGIIYNPAKVQEALGTGTIDSWAAIFNPVNAEKLSKCGLSFLDSPDEVVSAALMYLGKDVNAPTTEDLAAAEEMLMKMRSSVTYFSSSKHISDLANGDLCVAIGYSGDAAIVNSRTAEAANGITVLFAIPKEGSKVAFDMLAVPADAPHKESAFKYINHLLDPQVMAKITNYVQFPNAVEGSKAFIDPAVLENPIIYPPKSDMDRLVVVKPQDARLQRVMTRLWTKIKTGN